MKGAMALPSTRTISPPSSNIMRRMGRSQNFFLTFRKSQSSRRIDTLELFSHSAGFGAWGRARNPVGSGFRVEAAAHRVVTKAAHEKTDRRERAKEKDADDDRMDHVCQKQAQARPAAVQAAKQGWTEDRGQQEASGHHSGPKANGAAGTQRPEGDHGPEDGEDQAEGTV